MRRLVFLVGSAVATVACSADPSPVLSPDPVVVADLDDEFEGRADIAPTGNRVSTGAGDLRGPAIEVQLDAPAVWIVPSSAEAGAPWVAVLDDGRLVWIEPRKATVDVLDDDWGDAEPLVRGADGIEAMWDAPTSGREDVLADVRPVSDGEVDVLLVDPTGRYGHGVLGDGIEAGAVEIRSIADGAVRARIELDGDVIEGRSAIIGDADGDGTNEILVTQSNGGSGARLVLYDADGRLVAQSDPIGQGNRWRNQVAIAPVGPDGEIEIVDVRTPHLGRTLEWFRLVDGELTRVASLPGFTNHVLDSRNLDLAIVADADSDGRLEVIAPTASRESLAVVARTEEGAEVAFTVELGSPMSSNFGAVDHPDGGATYAAGTGDGLVRFWVS